MAQRWLVHIHQAILDENMVGRLTMMKVKKRLFALLLTVATVFALAAHAFALEDSTVPVTPVHTHETTVAIEGESVNGIQPRRLCGDCGSIMYSYCCGDYEVVENGTHTYDWGSKTCYVYWLSSQGKYMCYTCFNTEPLDYADDFGDRHYCLETHTSCGQGDITWCTMGGIT